MSIIYCLATLKQIRICMEIYFHSVTWNQAWQLLPCTGNILTFSRVIIRTWAESGPKEQDVLESAKENVPFPSTAVLQDIQTPGCSIQIVKSNFVLMSSPANPLHFGILRLPWDQALVHDHSSQMFPLGCSSEDVLMHKTSSILETQLSF